MRKITDEEPSDQSSGDGRGEGEVDRGSGPEGNDAISVSPVAGEKPAFKPKGSSITLVGSGRRDGSDVNNSMSVSDFYKYMLENKP